MRHSSAVADGIGGSDEGQRRKEHLVIRLDPRQAQRYMQRSGAVDYCYRVFCTGKRGKLRFEPINELSHRRDETRIETLLEVDPFIACKPWFMQSNRT